MRPIRLGAGADQRRGSHLKPDSLGILWAWDSSSHQRRDIHTRGPQNQKKQRFPVKKVEEKGFLAVVIIITGDRNYVVLLGPSCSKAPSGSSVLLDVCKHSHDYQNWVSNKQLRWFSFNNPNLGTLCCSPCLASTGGLRKMVSTGIYLPNSCHTVAVYSI